MICVVDLEATCWDAASALPGVAGATHVEPESEIIEIGAVMVDESYERVSEFDVICRPVKHPILSDFCVELTGITQGMVECGHDLAATLRKFGQWIHAFAEHGAVLASWGVYDRNMLLDSCYATGVWYPFDSRHMNVKNYVADKLGLAKPTGLSKSLRKAGLWPEGREHRGIDDAKNTARLLKHVTGRVKLIREDRK